MKVDINISTVKKSPRFLKYLRRPVWMQIDDEVSEENLGCEMRDTNS